tara:strand:+ start:467 stop:1909 length:1443 start_codon:yes stop_codon:yes gene_type:complete
MNKTSIVRSFYEADISDDIQISSVSNDSRDVEKGALFFARNGSSSNGLHFINEAVKNGAVCIISDQRKPSNINIPFIRVKNLEHSLVSFLFKFYDLNPDNFLFHGVTGTNGKTSTAFMSHQILQKLGKTSIYIGTLGAIIEDELVHTKGNTTPGIFELFNILKLTDKNKKNFILLELSSHALDQNRLLDLEFFQTMLLNIQSDHLDYHSSLEQYIDAKLAILNVPSINLPIVNFDSLLVKENLAVNTKLSNFKDLHFKDSHATFACKIHFNPHSASMVSLNYPKIDISINIDLFPRFNLENFACAVALISESLSSEDCQFLDRLEIKLPPGRSEFIETSRGKVFIDFAHDPQAMKNILLALKESYDDILLVFGCGGERDRLKRPEMMRVAQEFSETIFFTSDNSRNEDFSSIEKDALRGCNFKNLQVIESREDAIKNGLKNLRKDNILVILGKGHETFMEVGGNKIPFNDRECVLRNVKV